MQLPTKMTNAQTEPRECQATMRWPLNCRPSCSVSPTNPSPADTPTPLHTRAQLRRRSQRVRWPVGGGAGKAGLSSSRCMPRWRWKTSCRGRSTPWRRSPTEISAAGRVPLAHGDRKAYRNGRQKHCPRINKAAVQAAAQLEQAAQRGQWRFHPHLVAPVARGHCVWERGGLRLAAGLVIADGPRLQIDLNRRRRASADTHQGSASECRL